jgi:hypothetical protein
MKLQNINLRLRTKLKELNQQADKALNLQSVNKHGPPVVSNDRPRFRSPRDFSNGDSPTRVRPAAKSMTRDPAYMLEVRQKEIVNAKKQVEINSIQINKLKKILERLGINPMASPGTTETVPTEWEEKYKLEL